MSTNINVVVGDGGIVGRAQREQEEARWKLTERERARREAAPAVAVVTGDAVLEGQIRRPSVVLDELAANRRRKSGTGGIVWVVTPGTAYFAALWGWRSPADSPDIPDPLIGDTMPIRVGSGDGSTWVETSLSLPGTSAFGDATREPFGPVLQTEIIGYDSGIPVVGYPTDPLGQIVGMELGFIDDSKVIQLAMPCGNGSAVVLVGARAAGSVHGRALRCDGSYFWDHPVVGPFWNSENNYGAVVLTPSAFSAHAIKAFVVSQTGCREVSIPGGLRSALDQLWSGTTWVSGSDTTYGAPTLVPGASNAYFYAFGEYNRRKLEDAISAPSVRDYGVMHDLMQGATVTLRSASPSVFSLFRNYSSLFDAVDFRNGQPYYEPTANIANALQALGVPVPNHFAAIDGRGADYQALQEAIFNSEPGYEDDSFYADPNRYITGFDAVRVNTIPATFFDVIPQDAAWKKVNRMPLAAGRATSTAPIEDAIFTPIWHYDWGEPAYCRQQLLALGFTAADLTP